MTIFGSFFSATVHPAPDNGLSMHSNNNNSIKRGFITGSGRAIPGVDQLKGKGTIVDSNIILNKMIQQGISNPKTGKPVTADWAKRYLGSNTLSIGKVTEFEEAFDHKLGESCEDITEIEMGVSAAKMALDNAGLKAEDIDCILHFSGSLRIFGDETSSLGTKIHDSKGLNGCMREYTDALPGLRPDCVLQHQDSGCIGVTLPLQMAKAMVSGGDFRNILVVASAVFPRKAWKESVRANEMTQWINYVLFGDGASAFVLRGANSPSEVMPAATTNMCFEILKINSVTDTASVTFQSFFLLNNNDNIKDDDKFLVAGQLNTGIAKHFAPTLRQWLKDQSIQISHLSALVVHQPNSFVMQKIKRFLAGDKLYDVANKYGNLVAASTGVQFYEQVTLGNAKIKQDSLIALFTFGAHAGNAYGGFLARAHVGEN